MANPWLRIVTPNWSFKGERPPVFSAYNFFTAAHLQNKGWESCLSGSNSTEVPQYPPSVHSCLCLVSEALISYVREGVFTQNMHRFPSLSGKIYGLGKKKEVKISPQAASSQRCLQHCFQPRIMIPFPLHLPNLKQQQSFQFSTT